MRRFLALIAALLPAAAEASEVTATFGPDNATRTATIRSTTDLAAFGPVIEAFLTTRPDTRIIYEQWGSNDLYRVTAKDCAEGDAAADLVISSAVHHMVALVNEGCGANHSSAATATLASQMKWRDQLWGITREPAVMVYNRDLLAPHEVPRSRFDLLDLLRPSDSRFAGRIATYDIEDSGLGFLLAFSDSLEATTFGGLMEAFGRTGAIATCCSAEIIDAVASGEYLVAYNVLGSYALQRARGDDRLGVVAPGDYTLILARAAMIPAAAPSNGMAHVFLDYLLSPDGRAELEAQDLIVRLGEESGAPVEVSGTVEALERPIGLHPPLLVAMDADKREIFTQRWRDAFPH
ncbi:iron(III) transport system substrate-binding protein [Palleronia marisminoris]|uniref:Bacterial extracellular solute-binding protein n=1 Tax=Palleronia marisminoris TaxID=315423 RepID=A0A1Y5SQN8_9RHOB|nr:ABC transporter substrate-binding protein [Palleronia marisminoris]SFG93633.1 iron(III) transport system substrate-binding protein [Palleronia marisminoris]SLN45749.1 Bacterial extracellular solute-binding protein [Palleronia marisminoris]